MAAVEPPSLEKHGLSEEKRGSQTSFADEKGVHRPESVDLANAEEVGEVFADGPRLIDLGDDGRERPIGVLPSILTIGHSNTTHRKRHRLCYSVDFARR
jgi:hypothetical protein